MGSCIRFEGQLILFTNGAGEPCYRCWYGEAPDTLEDCPGAGVFSPVAGVIGSAMAHLALLWLASGRAPAGLHLFDGFDMTWRTLSNERRAGCPVCGGG